MALGRGFGGGGAGTPGANGNTIAQFEFVTSVRPSYQDANGWRYVPLVVDNDDKQEMQCIAPATGTVNFNSRSGLNANVDIPKQSGVYFVAKSFNSASSSYTLDVYFNKSVVGATITSAYIKDCNGVTLWSV